MLVWILDGGMDFAMLLNVVDSFRCLYKVVDNIMVICICQSGSIPADSSLYCFWRDITFVSRLLDYSWTPSILSHHPSFNYASRLIPRPNLAYKCPLSPSISCLIPLTSSSNFVTSSSFSLFSVSISSCASDSGMAKNESPILYCTGSSSSRTSSSSVDRSLRSDCSFWIDRN